MARRYIIGFVAGALAVVVFHQAMILVLHYAGQTPNFPWSMKPTGSLGLPAVINSMFWGGVWGVVFVAVSDRIPAGNTIVRGGIFGLLGPWLIGNGLLVPFFKSTPYLFAFDPKRMIIGALIGASFGIGLAIIFRMMRRG